MHATNATRGFPVKGRMRGIQGLGSSFGLESINTAASNSPHICEAKRGLVVRINREFTGTFGYTPSEVV